MYDLVCFSHLRWRFVFQRPHHLLTRCARHRRVLYFEEPVPTIEPSHLAVYRAEAGVEVLTPMVQHGLADQDAGRVQADLVERALLERGVQRYVSWFYTPMAVPVARGLAPVSVVYDCMDELSAFKDADPELLAREHELLASADVVFTGGHSLYEAKRARHSNVHVFPSAVDAAHFASARRALPDPADQAAIPHPRLGFCGVIDERLDVGLLDGAARARPDFSFVLLGPVAKIDERELPRRSNIHYLGPKAYEDLPSYFSSWDVAILPFARNEATRFISPTKTPEYLAAGKPVVSTSIRDVVRAYGQTGLCHIADSVEDFTGACERALLERDSASRLEKVDRALESQSWDETWARMSRIVDASVRTPPQRSGTYLRRSATPHRAGVGRQFRVRRAPK